MIREHKKWILIFSLVLILPFKSGRALADDDKIPSFEIKTSDLVDFRNPCSSSWFRGKFLRTNQTPQQHRDQVLKLLRFLKYLAYMPPRNESAKDRETRLLLKQLMDKVEKRMRSADPLFNKTLIISIGRLRREANSSAKIPKKTPLYLRGSGEIFIPETSDTPLSLTSTLLHELYHSVDRTAHKFGNDSTSTIDAFKRHAKKLVAEWERTKRFPGEALRDYKKDHRDNRHVHWVLNNRHKEFIRKSNELLKRYKEFKTELPLEKRKDAYYAEMRAFLFEKKMAAYIVKRHQCHNKQTSVSSCYVNKQWADKRMDSLRQLNTISDVTDFVFKYYNIKEVPVLDDDFVKTHPKAAKLLNLWWHIGAKK